MIDPIYIKVGAVVAGAALLLWPLVPKAVAALKVSLPGRGSKEPGLIEATTALSLVKSYLGSDVKAIEDAIDTLAIAVVKKGL